MNKKLSGPQRTWLKTVNMSALWDFIGEHFVNYTVGDNHDQLMNNERYWFTESITAMVRNILDDDCYRDAHRERLLALRLHWVYYISHCQNLTEL